MLRSFGFTWRVKGSSTVFNATVNAGLEERGWEVIWKGLIFERLSDTIVEWFREDQSGGMEISYEAVEVIQPDDGLK